MLGAMLGGFIGARFAVGETREEVGAGFCRQTPNERGRHRVSLFLSLPLSLPHAVI